MKNELMIKNYHDAKAAYQREIAQLKQQYELTTDEIKKCQINVDIALAEYTLTLILTSKYN